MLTLIEGRSGCGKTARLFEKLCAAVKGGAQKVMYLMPEQSSFECETQFLRMLGPYAARKVKVMSFTRLYYLVMSETGMPSGESLDDSIRSIIMSYTLEDIADELKLYAKHAKKPQFAELAAGAVKELKQCGIMPEALKEKAGEAGSPELRQKLRELSFIYEAYNANVERSGVDPYDNDIRLEKRIAETNYFKDYIIAVDDFSGFTAQQHKIIELMMEQCGEMYFSLCLDPAADEELFFTVERTRKRLLRSASKLGVKCRAEKDLIQNKRTNSADLKLVEENIYRAVPEKSELIPEDVTLVQAADVYEECEYIAGRISDMALSGECRYRDIAVVFRSADRYDGIIDDIFKKYDVPFFMSRAQSAETKPLMRLVSSALEYALKPNDERKLMTAVKSGLMGISPYQAAQLENYVYVWGLKGRSFFSPFERNPRGFEPNMTESDQKTLDEINETRGLIAEPFAPLLETLTGGDGFFESKDISAALYDFLIKCGVDELIRAHAVDGDEFAGEEARLWDMLIAIFDKLHSSLGKRRITVARYAELFKLILKGASFSDIPQTLDQVLIGKADSVRFSKPYAVFVIGAIDGEFPHIPVADGVFNDAERKDLIGMGLPLYDSTADLFRQEKFFVYNAVSAPTDKLVVSYPKSGLSGGSTEPSTIIGEIKKIFPLLPVLNASDADDLSKVATERTAFELYAKKSHENSALIHALGEYLTESRDYSSRLDLLGQNIKNVTAHLSQQGAAAAVFGRDKRLSASQIENFYECPFRYFCNYGMKLRDRKKASLDSRIYGNLLHFIMDKVITEYKKRGYKPFDDDEIKELLDKLLDEFMNSDLGGEADFSERFKRVYYRSKKRIWKVLSNMFEELSHTMFRPADAEVKIGLGGSVSEYRVATDRKSTVSISGKIDRVDILDGGNERSVRIIDYKTNGKKFSADEVVYGLNLQMLIYLMAIAENGSKKYGGELSPAAIFYMKSDSGTVSVEKLGAEKEELAKEADAKKAADLRLNGIYVDSEAVAGALDEKYIDGAEKSRIPFSKLEALFACVRDKIIAMSDDLDDGVIEAVPTRKSGSGAMVCDWCDHRDICRREKDDKAIIVSKDGAAKVLEEKEKSLEGEDDD